MTPSRCWPARPSRGWTRPPASSSGTASSRETPSRTRWCGPGGTCPGCATRTGSTPGSAAHRQCLHRRGETSPPSIDRGRADPDPDAIHRRRRRPAIAEREHARRRAAPPRPRVAGDRRPALLPRDAAGGDRRRDGDPGRDGEVPPPSVARGDAVDAPGRRRSTDRSASPEGSSHDARPNASSAGCPTLLDELVGAADARLLRRHPRPDRAARGSGPAGPSPKGGSPCRVSDARSPPRPLPCAPSSSSPSSRSPVAVGSRSRRHRSRRPGAVRPGRKRPDRVRDRRRHLRRRPGHGRRRACPGRRTRGR